MSESFDLNEKGKYVFSCSVDHSFTYGSWKEFHKYSPYALDQWKKSILFWWHCNEDEYILYYIPMKTTAPDSIAANRKTGLLEEKVFTVRISRQADEAVEEIRSWIWSMRPDMWKLGGPC